MENTINREKDSQERKEIDRSFYNFILIILNILKNAPENNKISEVNNIDRILTFGWIIIGVVLAIIGIYITAYFDNKTVVNILMIILRFIIIPFCFFWGIIHIKTLKSKNNKFIIINFNNFLFLLVTIEIVVIIVLHICFNHKLEESISNSYIKLLKDKELNKKFLRIETDLIELSLEPMRIKKLVIEKILNENDPNCFQNDIMPIVYHAMIGVSKNNYKKILDFSLNHLHSWNNEKVLILFSKDYFDFNLKDTYIENLNEKLKNMTFDEYGSIDKQWFLYFTASVLKNIGIEELNDVSGKRKYLKKIEKSKNLFVRLRVAEINLHFNEKKSIEILTSIVDEELKLNKPHKYNPSKEEFHKDIILKRTAEILGYIKNKDSIILLKRLILEEKNTEINEKALSSLVKLGKTASDSLIELLKETKNLKNLQMKYIVTALGEIKDRRAVPYLINILESKSGSEIRLNAIEALGKIGNPDAVIPLIKYLELDDQDSKKYVIKALGRIQDKRAVTPILNLIKEIKNQKDILAELVAALGNIGDIRAIDPIIEILKMDIISEQILENAGIALGKFEMDSLDKLISILEFNVENDYIQLSIISALGKYKNITVASNALINCLKTTDSKEKQKKIIEALGEIGDENAIMLLINFIKDDELGEFAANALGKTGWSSRAALVYLEQIYYKNSDLSKNFIIARAMINICPWNRSQIKIIDQIIKNPLIKMPLNCLIKNDMNSSYALLDLFNVIGYSTKNKVNLKYYNPENFWVMMDWWARYKQMWN